MHLSVCLYVCLSTTCMQSAHGSQKRATDPLELALQKVLRIPVLFSGRVATFNLWAILLAPKYIFRLFIKPLIKYSQLNAHS